MKRKTLREVTVKTRLERIDTQEGITVEVLLDQWSNGAGYELQVCKKAGVQAEEVRQTNECKECGWVIEQRRTHRAYGGSKYILLGL